MQVPMHKKPVPIVYKKMDSVDCGLLKKANISDFTVPIIRIVSALGGEKSFLKHMTHKSPTQGATNFDAAGHPLFTSYDFWCSGIGPDLLTPVDECNEEAQSKGKISLRKTDKFHDVFSGSKAPSLRRSYPAGGENQDYFEVWMDAEEDEDEDEDEGVKEEEYEELEVEDEGER